MEVASTNINENDSLTLEEKNIEFQKAEKEILDIVDNRSGDFIGKIGGETRRDIIVMRLLAALILLLDILNLVIPLVILLYGYITPALVMFAITGVFQSMSMSKELENMGQEVERMTQVAVVVSYLIIQLPFIVLLIASTLA